MSKCEPRFSTALVLAATMLVALISICGCRILGNDIRCDDAAACPEQLPFCSNAGFCNASEADDAGPRDGGGSNPDLLANLSEEFEGANQNLLEVTGALSLLHVDRAVRIAIENGALTIVAENPPATENYAWFGDAYGPLAFKELTGDFAVMTSVSVVDNTDPSSPPTGTYNAGGFLVRDPAGTQAANENWVLYSVGTQAGAGYWRNAAKTVRSTSGLYLNPQAFASVLLLVCRVGSEFGFWFDNGNGWQEERHRAGTTEAQFEAWSEVDTTGVQPLRFSHPDLPETLQVGLLAHSWDTAPDDFTRTRASFDYLRFATPEADLSACPEAFAFLP